MLEYVVSLETKKQGNAITGWNVLSREGYYQREPFTGGTTSSNLSPWIKTTNNGKFRRS